MLDDIIYFLALHLIEGLGPRRLKTLFKKEKNPAQLFQFDRNELQRVPGIGAWIADQIVAKKTLKQAEQIHRHASKLGMEILCWTSADYPKNILVSPDPPPVLYLKGNKEILNRSPSIAVVGTRSASAWTKAWLKQFLNEAAELNPVTASGMARGIDLCCHLHSVTLNIPTVCFLAHSLDKMYPAEHRIYLPRILSEGGALLSEYPPGTEAEKEYFPMRNRLIAAFSEAVLVVESPNEGGSVITAEFAFQYNRELFAVPGRPIDKRSLGCNALIKSNRATPLESLADMTQVMGWDSRGDRSKQLSIFPDLSKAEEEIIALFKTDKELHIDEIIVRSKIDFRRIPAILLSLELKELLRSIPGKRFYLSDEYSI